MRIKIHPQYADKIEHVLGEANRGAEMHTYRSYDDIARLAHKAETQLYTLGLPRGKRKGAGATARSGAALPTSYRFQRIVTWVVLERGVKDWFLVNATSYRAWREGGGMNLLLTPDQDEAVVANLRSHYTLKEDKT